jgi:hypothetical protein
MKKIVFTSGLSVLIIIIFVTLLLSDGLPYTRGIFENQIMKEYSDNTKVEIQNEKDIDNIKTLMFYKDNNIGKCILVKNVFGRYKIFVLACGDGRLYRCSIDKINNKYYFILLGKNTNNMDKAIVNIYGLDSEDQPFEEKKEVKIPDDEYFIVIEEMDSSMNYNNNFSDATFFYDKNGNDITEELYK